MLDLKNRRREAGIIYWKCVNRCVNFVGKPQRAVILKLNLKEIRSYRRAFEDRNKSTGSKIGKSV
jgi:hypothetical protein